VVVGGSTFTLGLEPITVTEADGTAITIGPDGITFGTQTITLPTVTAPTTITSDGITFTLQPGSVTPTASPSSPSGATQPAPETIVIGTQTFTGSLPLSTPSASETTVIRGETFTIPVFPSTPSEIIVIGSQSVTIGTSASTVVNDGTTFVVGGPGGGVAVGTQTFNDLPPGSTTLVTGGVTLTLGSAPASTPLTSGIAAITALQPMASQVIAAFVDGALAAANFAAMEEPTLAAAAELDTSFSVALGREFFFFFFPFFPFCLWQILSCDSFNGLRGSSWCH
jgi:hypothetical protein